jgi:hypothetical protein
LCYNCAQKQQIIIAWLGIGKLAVFLYFDLYETMNIYYILSLYSKYNQFVALFACVWKRSFSSSYFFYLVLLFCSLFSFLFCACLFCFVFFLFHFRFVMFFFYLIDSFVLSTFQCPPDCHFSIMITMKINGTISRHNSCYMFKKRKLRTKTTNNYCMAWHREARGISLFRSINMGVFLGKCMDRFRTM